MLYAYFRDVAVFVHWKIWFHVYIHNIHTSPFDNILIRRVEDLVFVAKQRQDVLLPITIDS